MSTQCNTNQLEFLAFKSNIKSQRTPKVIARFDADKVSSDGGVALLREAEHRFGVIRRFSECFRDRSTPYMRSNQLRMYSSGFAYVLMERVRRVGLKGTGYAMAQCDTIRLKLIKIGAVIRTSARRVALSFSQCYPYQDLFRHLLQKLQAVHLDS